VVYAVAALEAGCAFVDFTPSVATTVPGVRALARALGLPLAGRDGKTGETLVKTALAPMLVDRALRVRAWSGTNLLGGGDGASLADPERRAAKLASKAAVLGALVGEQVDAPLTIEHVPAMGEWKTAWDHIVFEGFLGTRMTLQFTWEGCDSSLAAPLVLDLARLAAAGLRAGQSGPLPALAYFFKDPIGTDEHRVARQFDDLVSWATSLATSAVRS
jgi:myo-inositol-1-phosphate synthase